MTFDGAKNITITYNTTINLPKQLDFGGNNRIFYHYTASGAKLVKHTVLASGTGSYIHYIGNMVYDGGSLSYIMTDEGRLVATGTGADRKFLHEYNLKDHLGNNRVTFMGTDLGGAVDIVQTTSYYPFGLVMNQMNGHTATGYNKNKYLYNGKELQDDVFAGSSLNWFDYGARFYDPQIGRWTTPDPMSEKYRKWSPYNYAVDNPIRFIDPDGMAPSTHTDEEGNVVKVYDDGDLGVYKHSGKGLAAQKSVEDSYTKSNTAAGGINMGESLHSLSFADQNLYNKTGEVREADIKIDFGSTNLSEKVQDILGSKPSLIEYAGKAGTNGTWDLKSKDSNGSLLYGKYASPRDAGNFAAGAVAQLSGIEPIAQFGFGAYNMTGNSKPLTGMVTVAVAGLTLINPGAGLGVGSLIGKFGEDRLSQRSIDLGKKYIKNR
jgi:RHS repeat-associated protein